MGNVYLSVTALTFIVKRTNIIGTMFLVFLRGGLVVAFGISFAQNLTFRHHLVEIPQVTWLDACCRARCRVLCRDHGARKIVKYILVGDSQSGSIHIMIKVRDGWNVQLCFAIDITFCKRVGSMVGSADGCTVGCSVGSAVVGS